MSPAGEATALRCAGLSAGHEGRAILTDLDLSLGRGEVMAILGPSGAGKTTLLHSVAGFSRPLRGEIWLDDELVAGESVFIPPERRRVGVVFQDNALWPHLDVLATVAYPLRRQGRARHEAELEARRLLERLGLAALSARRPHELSGGEQQRVGLARALARDAGLYLLDEPTVHLDLPLREMAQGLIEAGRRQGSAAAIYTTHDAGDALAVADRVAVLVAGRLAQVGAAEEVYERPLNKVVARLTGSASVLHVMTAPGASAVVDAIRIPVQGPATGGWQDLLIRPGWASLGGPLKGRVVRVRFQGPHTDHDLQTSAGEVLVRHDGPPRAQSGEETGWSLRRGWLLQPS